MKPLWIPSKSFIAHSQLSRYRAWLAAQYDIRFPDYKALWKWSVKDISRFWESIVRYFEIDYSGTYKSAVTGEMPETGWFEGMKLNYVAHIFRDKEDEAPGIFWRDERGRQRTLLWKEIKRMTARLQHFLEEAGVGVGDRVGAFLPNIPEATIGFWATAASGAVWSSCSPDFGAESVIDRLSQIQPKVLLVSDGYSYSGKPYDKMEVVRDIVKAIPSIEKIILIPFLKEEKDIRKPDDRYVFWSALPETERWAPEFKMLSFGHPIWVLYSSGTTGKPKAITHGHGGVLLEHFKYLAFHNDVHSGEHFFWFSTTGWMMWNFVNAAPLLGAKIVLYEGNPGYPDLNILWKYASGLPIHHFGTSAPFLVACMKRGLKPGAQFDLKSLRSIGSTGAPLPPEGFRFVMEDVSSEVWLCSMSGGTDVCTAFVGGCPERSVYAGEIQCRALGCDLDAWDQEGHPVRGEVGEMVIKQPMPSMPVFFWGDPGMKRYTDSYFSMFPGIWRHGDWIEITERDSIVIYGRSDATLNRHGVRIGTAEIYNVVEKFPEIQTALVVNLELPHGRHYMPMYVVLSEGVVLTEELKKALSSALRAAYSPRHVPDAIIACPGIPTTISGKKMEAPVKRILLGMPIGKAINLGAMKNPETVDFFIREAKKIQ